MEWIKELLFPRHCPICDEIVMPFGRKICAECEGKLKILRDPWCIKCGKKLLREETVCEDCRKRAHTYERGRALYEYDSVKRAIYRFKYGGRAEFADFFGEELCRHLGNYILGIKPDALIPVPLHKNRQRKRGYNQSALLARKMGELLGIPVYEKLLVRNKDTVPLKYQNPRERQNNLKKAFNIVENDVKLKTVLVVDDIYTTGATIDETASILKENGVCKVYFITLACGEGI